MRSSIVAIAVVIAGSAFGLGCKPTANSPANSMVASADASAGSVQFEVSITQSNMIMRLPSPGVVDGAYAWRQIKIASNLGNMIYSKWNDKQVWMVEDKSPQRISNCALQGSWTRASDSTGTLKAQLWNCKGGTAGELTFEREPYAIAENADSPGGAVFRMTSFLNGPPSLEITWDSSDKATPSSALRGKVYVRTNRYSNSDNDLLATFERHSSGQYRIQFIDAAAQSFATHVPSPEVYVQMTDIASFMIWSIVNLQKF